MDVKGDARYLPMPVPGISPALDTALAFAFRGTSAVQKILLFCEAANMRLKRSVHFIEEFFVVCDASYARLGINIESSDSFITSELTRSHCNPFILN